MKAKPVGSAVEIDAFLFWLLNCAGLNPGAYRPTSIQRRLDSCLRSLRVTSTRDAKALLATRPDLLWQALDSVLIGVSGFFRDAPVFERLKDQVLPTLLASRKNVSACGLGVSDGQELYSVAILLAEMQALRASTLLGVDRRPTAIQRARRGAYSPEEMAAVGPVLREKYFTAMDEGCVVSAGVRKQIDWEIADVFAWRTERLWDLILFRNVVIYLEPNSAAAVWARICESISPGGYLVTGTAERPPQELPLARLGPCIYRRMER